MPTQYTVQMWSMRRYQGKSKQKQDWNLEVQTWFPVDTCPPSWAQGDVIWAPTSSGNAPPRVLLTTAHTSSFLGRLYSATAAFLIRYAMLPASLTSGGPLWSSGITLTTPWVYPSRVLAPIWCIMNLDFTVCISISILNVWIIIRITH